MSEADANHGVRSARVRRQRAWNRFLFTALALHVPLFIYPILRLGAWLDAPWLLTLLVLLPLASSQIVARLYLRGRRDRLAETWRVVSDFWLGLSPILLMTLLVFEVLVVTAMVRPFDAAVSTLTVTALLGTLGFVIAATPMVKTIHLTSTKVTAPVRFVQITDVHIGSRHRRFLERIVFRINRLEPDFVCITGDFIDQPGVPETNLISLRSILCPIYFSTGNHERYEDLDAILPRLERLGVNVLRSRSLDFSDEVQVIGIDDMDDAEQVARELADINVDTDKYVVLLYHRPRGLEAAAEHGVDLMLSGHTHNGQIFPFNFVVGRVFERIVGMYEHDGARLYVSQGTGTWGPVLRLGTRAEITEFIISPETKPEGEA